MFSDRNETMMMENARTVRRSVDANEEARERKSAESTPLREAFRFVPSSIVK
jgi:hypothetical protein